MEIIEKYNNLNKESQEISHLSFYLDVKLSNKNDYEIDNLQNDFIDYRVIKCDNFINDFKNNIQTIEKEIELIYNLIKIADEELLYCAEDKKDSLLADKEFFLKEIQRLKLALKEEKIKLHEQQQLKEKMISTLNNINYLDDYQLDLNYNKFLKEELSIIEKYKKDLESIKVFSPIIDSIQSENSYNSNLLNDLYKSLCIIKKDKGFYDDIQNKIISLKNDILNFKIYSKEILNNNKMIEIYNQLILMAENEIKMINLTFTDATDNNLDYLLDRKSQLNNNISQYKKRINSFRNNTNFSINLVKYKNMDILLEKQLSSLEQIQKFYKDIDKLTTNLNSRLEKKEEEKHSEVTTKRSSDFDDYMYFVYENYEKNRKRKKHSEVTTKRSSDFDDYMYFVYENHEKNRKRKKHSEVTTKRSSDFDDYIYFVYENHEKNRKNQVESIDLASDNVVNKKSTDEKETLKITNVKKSFNFSKIKKSIKKCLSKIVVGVLIGVVAISCFSIQTDPSQIKNDVKSNNIKVVDIATPTTVLNNLKVNKIEYNSDNKLNDCNFNKQLIETNKNIELSTVNIGDSVEVNGNIYTNALDASYKVNGMQQYYSVDDARSVSAIFYESGNEQIVITKHNKDKIKKLKNMKYKIISYCVSNDKENIEYEGWYNAEDVKLKKLI